MRILDLASIKVMGWRITLRDYGPMDRLWCRRKLGPQRWIIDLGRYGLVLENL